MPVCHLSVLFFNSGLPTISFEIPRDVLLRWAREKLITIGSEGDLNGKPYRIEIVVKEPAWNELVKFITDIN